MITQELMETIVQERLREVIDIQARQGALIGIRARRAASAAGPPTDERIHPLTIFAFLTRVFRTHAESPVDLRASRPS